MSRGQGRVHRRKRAPCWSYTAGAKGQTVTAYERVPGGPLQARCFDATLRDGRGGYRRITLGHRDREKAKSYALEQAAKLLEGRAELVEGTIARLFAAYQTHRTPHKSAGEQSEDVRRITMWTRMLGARKDPHLITRGEWERVGRRSALFSAHFHAFASRRSAASLTTRSSVASSTC